MANIFTSIDNFLGKTVGNVYVQTFLMVFFIVYGTFIAPKLPPFLAFLFANPLFKALVMFAILILWNYTPQVAILVAIGLLLSLQTLQKYQLYNTVQNVASNLANTGVNILRQGSNTAGDFVENVGEAVGSVVTPLVGSTATGIKAALVNPLTHAISNITNGASNVAANGVSVVKNVIPNVACVGCNSPQPMSADQVLPPQPFIPEQVASVMNGCDYMGPQGLDYPQGYDGQVFGAEYGGCNSEL
jgi:hypothetical protein